MTESTARAPMPDAERAKQNRRLADAIRNGLCMSELIELFRSEARIRKVAQDNGLTIVKKAGGKHL